MHFNINPTLYFFFYFSFIQINEKIDSAFVVFSFRQMQENNLLLKIGVFEKFVTIRPEEVKEILIKRDDVLLKQTLSFYCGIPVPQSYLFTGYYLLLPNKI